MSSPSLDAVLNQKVLPGLDALRAIAVLLVFGFHFLVLPSGSGSLGVMIFFVLSGFLITRILLVEFSRSGAISLKDFYRRRALRIFPAFYFCWVLELLLLHAHGVSLARWEPWVSFLYLTDYARALAGHDQIHHMNIAWSLAIEEQFYLLWPAALLWMLKRGADAFRVVCIFIVSVWAYRAVMFLGIHVSWDYIYNALDMRIDALMIGAALSILARDKRRVHWLEGATARPPLIVLPATALAFSWSVDTRVQSAPWLMLLNFTLQPVAVALLLIQMVRHGGSRWRFLMHPATGFLARISYSLYLFHALVIAEGQRLRVPSQLASVFGFRIAAADGHVRLLVLVVPALVLPICSYYLLEAPLMRLRDRKPAAQPFPHEQKDKHASPPLEPSPTPVEPQPVA